MLPLLFHWWVMWRNSGLANFSLRDLRIDTAMDSYQINTSYIPMYESVWVIILTQTTVYSQQLLLDETRQGDPRINGGDSHTKLYIPSKIKTQISLVIFLLLGRLASTFKNPTICNTIRWFACSLGQMNHRLSVWCSKYYFFLYVYDFL